MTENAITYRLQHFIGLDFENYKTWKNLETLRQRSEFLQQNIANHILNFCRNVGFEMPNKGLEVGLESINKLDATLIKNAKVLCFDVIFLANIQLPQYLGLGRYKSMGYGVLSQV